MRVRVRVRVRVRGRGRGAGRGRVCGETFSPAQLMISLNLPTSCR